jgi:hypothetical protein
LEPGEVEHAVQAEWLRALRLTLGPAPQVLPAR